MGLFFFHFITESERDEDLIGVELDTAEAAYLKAVETAFSMAGELLAAGIDVSRCSFEITEARGELLMVLDFAELLKRDLRAPSCNQHTGTLASAIESTHRRVMTAKGELRSSFEQARSTLNESAELIARLDGLDRGRRISARHRDAA